MPPTLACRLFQTENKAQRAQEEFYFYLPLYLPNGIQKEKPASGREPQHIHLGLGRGWQTERNQASLLMRRPSVSHCFRVAPQESVKQMFAPSHLPVNGRPSLWSPRPQHPSLSLVQNSCQPQPPRVSWAPRFLGSPHVYIHNTSGHFFC